MSEFKRYLAGKIVEAILILTILTLLGAGVISGAIEISKTPDYDSIGLTIAIDDLTNV
ncbi:hypothetical protein [Roseibium aggregatum]|uniref:Uncharacterized protein n=1 Tax=Roseibium aggregatum TaxID=187304 RepID=A0A0M6Y6M0_9HYPH|nr:hypothetical protein [Roseibium aggregatum]CTQ45742.1 hypothetical protein LAL4801_04197 [Roseibium aggregatum]